MTRFKHTFFNFNFFNCNNLFLVKRTQHVVIRCLYNMISVVLGPPSETVEDCVHSCGEPGRQCSPCFCRRSQTRLVTQARVTLCYGTLCPQCRLRISQDMQMF